MQTQRASGIEVAALVHQHQVSVISRLDIWRGCLVYRAACLGRLFFAPLSPWFVWDLWRFMRRTKPDILHLHLPNTSVFWALCLPSARRIPWVVHWHSDVLGDKSPWFLRVLYPLYRFFEQAVLKRAKCIICTSEPYATSSEALAAFRTKVTVVPLGLPDLAAPLVSKRGEGALKVLMIGRLTYYKGHDFLLNALATLPAGLVELIIVGSGELRQALQKKIHQLGLQHTTLAGQVSADQLVALLDQCDLLALPSIEKTEAFGLVLLEAARRARPALVTDVAGSGMSWVVQHSSTGWVVPSGSSAALAEVINMLAEEPESCRKAGLKARKRFESLFAIDSVAQQISKIYGSVLS